METDRRHRTRGPGRVASVVMAALAALASWSCGSDAELPSGSETVESTHVLGIADRSNEFVSLAANGPFVVAAWAAADEAGATDIYTAASDDGGTTFGAPVRVNGVPGDARANGEQPPRVALVRTEAPSPQVVVFWLSRRPSGSVLLTARSQDGGRHYGEARVVPGTDTVGNRGWQTLAVAPGGNVRLAWLDHRRMAAPTTAAMAHTHHGANTTPTAGDATVDTSVAAQQSDLYFARSPEDPAAYAVTAGVCYCCKTAMVHGPDGAIYLAWRHVYPGNMRDIAFAVSRDDGASFSEPVRVSEDHWAIAGCPDDGPSMAVDHAGRVHVVWPTVVTAADGATRKTLFHAMTTDGHTFSPRTALPFDGDASHPQVIATDDGIVVAWDGYQGETAYIHRARGTVDATGVVQFTADPTATVRGRYPAMLVAGPGLITAWSDRQGQRSEVRLSLDLLK